jgi:hypothetical protein
MVGTDSHLLWPAPEQVAGTSLNRWAAPHHPPHSGDATLPIAVVEHRKRIRIATAIQDGQDLFSVEHHYVTEVSSASIRCFISAGTGIFLFSV